MFDIGGPEFFLLMVLALLIFGPRRLPQLGKQLGGFVAQARHAMRDMQGTLEREVALEDVKGAMNEVKGIQRDASAIARELAGFGPPPYVDPNRRRELPPDAVPGPPAEPGPDAEAPGAAAPPPAADPSTEPPSDPGKAGPP